jgi:hypothetical protein
MSQISQREEQKDRLQPHTSEILHHHTAARSFTAITMSITSSST